MAYIGKQPTTGDFVLLDNLTASATASYTMQRNSVNFEPQSANHMIVSLNGTIQKPGSSFTISGSTITFASALTSSDAIDFILVLGNVNDVGVATSVVDSAITKGKLDLISTSGSPGLTVKGDGSSENGTIQLNCSQNSHGVKISSPDHSSGQSYELILPTGNVTADKFLKVASVSGSGTTGIGQLSFADAGGSMASGFANTDVNQTIQSTSLTDLTNVTASITPSSTSSKVLIVGRVQSQSNSYGVGLGIVRGSTVIYEDEATSATYSGDSEYVITPFSFIDSPSTTSSTTYKIQVKTYSDSHIFQAGGDSNICLVEILG